MKTYIIRMRQGKQGGGKGALISNDLSLTLGCNNDQTLIIIGNEDIRIGREHNRQEAAERRQWGGIKEEVAYTMDTIGNFGIAQVEDDMEQQVYDARGNGDGKTANTITGDHANRVTDFTPLCVQQNQVGEVRVSPIGATLNTNSNASGRNAPLVASFTGGQGSKAGGIGYEENVSSTIKAAPSGSNQVPDVICVHGSQDPISNTEHANAVNRNNGLENCVAIGVDGYNQSTTKDVSKTISSAASDYHHVPCVCQNGEVAGTLTERHDSSPCSDRGQNVVAQYGISLDGRRELQPQEELSHTECVGTNPGYKIGTANHLSVRRLMPIETERLMGFPDNWTKIPWRGKPADECPDAPRYKACGNSMGVNCMRWIGLGIEAVDDGIRQKQHAKEDK